MEDKLGLDLEQKNDKKITVSIPSELYEKLKEIIKTTGFSSVDDYVNYLLRTKIGKSEEEEKEGLSEEDTEVVTSRLKALGYI